MAILNSEASKHQISNANGHSKHTRNEVSSFLKQKLQIEGKLHLSLLTYHQERFCHALISGLAMNLKEAPN